MRVSLILSIVAVAGLMTGCCCGPGAGGCGPCPGECNNCDDAGYGGLGVARGPIASLTQMRKSLVCGGGCGEAYYGEWTSTPPDACDPCCGPEFVGGATPCVPFCWYPGKFLGAFGGFYGQRFCDGCNRSISHCACGGGFDGGCGDAGCGGGCDGECGGGYSEGFVTGGSSGCATCNSSNSPAANRTIRTANPPPKVDSNHRTARATAIRRGMHSSNASRNSMYR